MTQAEAIQILRNQISVLHSTDAAASAAALVLERLEKLAEALYAISITLGLEVWDDFPKGDIEAILESVDRAQNALRLEAYLRGVRAANAITGRDPDALPEIGTRKSQ
jgi:hypothetical protein